MQNLLIQQVSLTATSRQRPGKTRDVGYARVLVVGADKALVDTACANITALGLQVERIDNGAAALDRISNQRPDLIVLDIALPDLDGYEVCRRLRRQPATEHLPVLMLTELDDPGTIDRAYEVGATEFVTKPIRWPNLSNRVRYMLRAAQTNEALRASQRRLANAQRLTRIGDWEWDIERGRLNASAQLCEMFGGDESVWEHNFDRVLELVHEGDRPSLQQALELASSVGLPFSLEHRIVLPDGTIRMVHHQVRVTRFGEHNAVLRLAGIVRDVTERKKAESRIRQLACFDTLTGLPNRQQFNSLLGNAVERADRQGTQVGLMFLDIDNFKRINDTLGHAHGDDLLKAVAQRLTDSARTSPQNGSRGTDFVPDVVSRIGGDEFTLILHDIQEPIHCSAVARRILDKFQQPIVIGGQEVYATPSIGIALYPNDGTEIDTLLMSADAAMYRAKEMGRNNFQFYDGSMNADARKRLSLESDLRRAIERDELFLQYQPKVDVSTGRICGAEALLRWQHPERGLVAPMQFIPLAEETGLIVAIGNWVIAAACSQIRAWRRAGLHAVPVSVNLAASHFRQIDLPAQIATTLQDLEVPAPLLELEVTETLLMADVATCQQTLRAIVDLGVTIAIDDFGTGYSSLAYLKKLPIDALKIDRSFVRDIATDPDDAAIVSAIVALAHNLKLKVVAEGVETCEQLQFLGDHGCDVYQGYLFSRPVDAAVFAEMLAAQSGNPAPAPIVSQARQKRLIPV